MHTMDSTPTFVTSMVDGINKILPHNSYEHLYRYLLSICNDRIYISF